MTAEFFASHRPQLSRMLQGMLESGDEVASVENHFVDGCMYRARVSRVEYGYDGENSVAFGTPVYAVCVMSSHPKAMGGPTWWWEDEL